MYFLSVNGFFDVRIILDKEGFIYDVLWLFNFKEFGVVYGYMFVKIIIFNYWVVFIYFFFLGLCNIIIFLFIGCFVFVVGFGNLVG